MQKASVDFGGWTPNSDQKGREALEALESLLRELRGEYIQVDLENTILCGLSIQGRRPISGPVGFVGTLPDMPLE